MIKVLLLILLTFPSVCFSADKWTKTDIALETSFQVLNFIDWGQTHHIADNPGFEEVNPFIGADPKDHNINNSFAIFAVAHLLITHNIKADQRKYWHYSMIIFKSLVINRNHNIGVKFSF